MMVDGYQWRTMTMNGYGHRLIGLMMAKSDECHCFLILNNASELIMLTCDVPRLMSWLIMAQDGYIMPLNDTPPWFIIANDA